MRARVTRNAVRICVAVNPRFPGQGQSSQGQSEPKARPKGVVDGNPVNIPEPLTCAVGGRSRVGETADGCAVELTISRRFGKSGRHKGKGRDESRGKTRKKSLTPAARKILVQLYTH